MSTFLLLEEKMKKVKTSSYNIGTSDVHKYVLRGFCWGGRQGLDSSSYIPKVLAYYREIKITLRLNFEGKKAHKKPQVTSLSPSYDPKIQRPHYETPQEMLLVTKLLMAY